MKPVVLGNTVNDLGLDQGCRRMSQFVNENQRFPHHRMLRQQVAEEAIPTSSVFGEKTAFPLASFDLPERCATGEPRWRTLQSKWMHECVGFSGLSPLGF